VDVWHPCVLANFCKSSNWARLRFCNAACFCVGGHSSWWSTKVKTELGEEPALPDDVREDPLDDSEDTEDTETDRLVVVSLWCA
jgi:hypothetical protein